MVFSRSHHNLETFVSHLFFSPPFSLTVFYLHLAPGHLGAMQYGDHKALGVSRPEVNPIAVTSCHVIWQVSLSCLKPHSLPGRQANLRACLRGFWGELSEVTCQTVSSVPDPP